MIPFLQKPLQSPVQGQNGVTDHIGKLQIGPVHGIWHLSS